LGENSRDPADCKSKAYVFLVPAVAGQVNREEPIAPWAVPHFNQTSQWDRSGGGALRSSLLIFPEMFQVLLDRMTSN
jgi:hypothetical protein